jgi:CHASE2 domain-containing sensor protein/signal transduction histidine kinase
MSDPPTDESLSEAPIFKARGWLLVEWSALLLAATLLVGCIVFTGTTTRLDNAIYDAALKLRHRPAPSDIVIVGIDSPSMAKLGPGPWPRETIATLLKAVTRDHPRAIIAQLLFASHSSASADAQLRAAIASAPVFLPEMLDDRGLNAHLIRPIPEFASVAAGVGLSNPSPDVDGIVRRVALYAPHGARAVPDVAALAAARTIGDPQKGIRLSHPPAAGETLTRQAEFLIPYAGPPGHFEQVSAIDLLNGLVKPGRFKDKYVLIGATAPGVVDNYPTPVSGPDGMSIVEIEANTLDAVLHQHLVLSLIPTATMILSLVLLWVTFFELLWMKPTQFALQPIGSVAIVAGAAGALILTGIWFPPMAIVIVRTVVQIVWSSRRLQAASDYFAQELAELQIRAGGAIVPTEIKGRLPMGDSVTRQMILIDETKRRIRELRRFVTDVLANFPDPVMVVTARGKVIMYNEAAVDLALKLGRSAEPGAYIQPILQDLAEARGIRAIQWPPDTGPGVPPPRGVAPGGRILEARYAPTGQGEEGEAKGWTVHLADVTAQVSAMRQREEALQLFTHDMRAPQSAILAALEHEDFQSVPQWLRDRIARNAMRTVALAEGFVRLAQAETAEYYNFAPIDFFHLLGDAADALWSIARSAGVEIVVPDPEREFVVDADRGLMARALINLLENACKFSPRGGRVVCTLTETRLRERSAVCCSILDQSDGTTTEEQRGLFDLTAGRSLPGEETDALPDPGSGARLGIGLAMVQTVVHRHDGVIDWRSEQGQGTVFTVTLPLNVDEESGVRELSSSCVNEPKQLMAPRLAFG